MTLNSFAVTAIQNAFNRESGLERRRWHDPRIAAWIVWSVRDNVPEEEIKTYNRARRVLQRYGIKKI